MIESLLCPWESPFLLVFSSNVPPLLYYSHLPVIIISVILGVFVYKNSKDLSSSVLVSILLLFSFYTLIDIMIWATNKSDIVMFLWSIQVMIEVLVFSAAFYLVYLVVNKKDLAFKHKLIFGAILMPFIALIPTSHNLIGINLATCNAIEGFVALYLSYALEALFTFLIIWLIVKKYFESRDKTEKKKILLLGIGIILFLFAFIWGNLIGSFTGRWDWAQLGLFGMPVFSTFLVYLIVQFRMFNLKIIAAQALVIGLWTLITSMLFLKSIENIRLITLITLGISIGFGILLVKSVKREIEERERIERLALDLEKANARLRELDQLKSEFLSFASHQIRSPLTAINGYSSMILQGDFGEIPEKIRGAIETMDKSSKGLVKIVNDFLDISRIEQGRMKYDMSDFDVKELAQEVVEELKPNIENKGLKVEFSSKGAGFAVNADKMKIKQVIGNIIDNSIKYTPEGKISVAVERDGKSVKISISDTGIGIPQEEISKLFSKFSRAKDAHKTNVTGTGLGLYVAKQMIEAHKGKIWVESPGKGKGSTFVIEVPLP